jgi:ankyrin repeat protein
MRSRTFIALVIAVQFGISGRERTEKAASLPKPVLQQDDVKPAEQFVASPAPDPANPAPAPDSPNKYSERTKQFLEAAEKGRISLMLDLLKQGTDVNDKDDDGQTALHKAVASGHRSAVIALLAHGADMGEKDAKGRTPLLVAAENGHAQLVSILTSPDSVKDLAGEALKSVGGDALKAVGLPNFTDRLGKLIGSSIDLADQTGQTPFMKAAANGHLEVVQLLQSRADLTRRDRQGKTALMLAAAVGDAQMVEHLATLGQTTTEQIRAADKDGKTALDLAAAAGHKNVVQVLRQATLAKAAGEGQMALVREVFESKDVPELDTAPALKAAAKNGATPVVRYFLEKWKDKPLEERQRLVGYPAKGYTGTALADASQAGNMAIVEALLDISWWKDKAALLEYINARIYNSATVESVFGQRPEMVELFKSRREALQVELKK